MQNGRSSALCGRPRYRRRRQAPARRERKPGRDAHLDLRRKGSGRRDRLAGSRDGRTVRRPLIPAHRSFSGPARFSPVRDLFS